MSGMVERLRKLKNELSRFSNRNNEDAFAETEEWIKRAKDLINEALGEVAAEWICRLDQIAFNAPCFAIVSDGYAYFDGADETVSKDVFQNGISKCSNLIDECIQKRICLEKQFASS